MTPPVLSIKTLSPEEIEKVTDSLKLSAEKDTSWLCQYYLDPEPLDWSGYNAQEDRKTKTPDKPKTITVFGPLIDSPPSHPDTVLTTIVYLDTFLKSFGMEYVHITLDMQLYIMACLI